jgi:hypothetical protein
VGLAGGRPDGARAYAFDAPGPARSGSTWPRAARPPLFLRNPALGDIVQQQLGNCWFLAALAAIVHLGTGDAVRRMMCDAGARAYVRLWDPGGAPHYGVVPVGAFLGGQLGATFGLRGTVLWALPACCWCSCGC